MSTLNLSLYREFFAAILDGSKRIEYRRRCPHWDRILSKPHARARFINGYSAARPWLELAIERIEKTPRQWLIHLAPDIKSSGNLHLLKASSSSRPSR